MPQNRPDAPRNGGQGAPPQGNGPRGLETITGTGGSDSLTALPAGCLGWTAMTS